MSDVLGLMEFMSSSTSSEDEEIFHVITESHRTEIPKISNFVEDVVRKLSEKEVKLFENCVYR